MKRLDQQSTVMRSRDATVPRKLAVAAVKGGAEQATGAIPKKGHSDVERESATVACRICTTVV